MPGGDLNDDPASDGLRPLVDLGDLTDVSEHPNFDGYHRKGTYRLLAEITHLTTSDKYPQGREPRQVRWCWRARRRSPGTDP